MLAWFTESTLKDSRAINKRINTIYQPSIKSLEELDNQLIRAQQLMQQWAFVQKRADSQERIEAVTLCTQLMPAQLARIDSISTLWTKEQQTEMNIVMADVQGLLLVYADVRKLLPDFSSYDPDLTDPIVIITAQEYFIPGGHIEQKISETQIRLRNLIAEERAYVAIELSKMNSSFGDLTQVFAWVAGVVVLIGIILAFFTIRSIVRPVNSLRNKLNNLSQGIYSLHSTRANDDEIGDMAQAVDRLIRNFERTKEFSLSIGAGKFDMPYEPLSQHDELGGALLQMRDDLASYRHQMEEKVAAQTLEIRAQKEQVEQQNERVTELYTDLQASIDYAQRLQNTILPGPEAIAEVFPNCFVFYRPKATVSGDFYWFANKGKKLMFAAADCTGHGVPGAFMSLVGHNALNQATKVYYKPSQVLNTVNRLSAQALRANENHLVKDGMDIALCTIDKDTMELEFSGAQNPVYVVRAGELIELDGDGFSIGSYVNGEREFTGKKMDLMEGDCLYTFSDGYADQFGGPSGKKFMRKQFRQLLLEIHTLSMEQQKEALMRRFDEWRGSQEQVDDVLVIGVRV
ncbi:MAG: SpoIIE family protein phosphatase [Flavobacteriales bacterium]|jgi:serine phosphatase RsbU (regulator of sigma subunit)/HAMP domain-containing protein